MATGMRQTQRDRTPSQQSRQQHPSGPTFPGQEQNSSAFNGAGQHHPEHQPSSRGHSPPQQHSQGQAGRGQPPSGPNLSFVLHGIHKVGFEDRPKPELKGPRDVMVQVKFTGICGSDVHYWEHGSIGPYKLTSPMVLGHESAGIVIQIGPEVQTLKVGDPVTLEPGIPCRYCARCKEGQYNLCPEMKFAATPPYDGTLANYYVLPEDLCYKLPHKMTLQEGALIEPTAVAVHITKQGKVKQGDNVIVFGAGPVGLLCCAVAKQYGAKKIIAVDIQPNRLAFAREFAATATYESQRISAEKNAQNLIQQNNLGLGADVCIDASGAEPSIQTAIHVLRTGGTYVQGGMGRDNCTFPIMAACTKELYITGSFRYGSGDYQEAVEYVASGKIAVKKLITGTVKFTAAQEAFERVKAGKEIKMLIGSSEEASNGGSRGGSGQGERGRLSDRGSGGATGRTGSGGSGSGFDHGQLRVSSSSNRNQGRGPSPAPP